MNKQLDAVTFGEPMAMFYANEAALCMRSLPSPRRWQVRRAM